MFKESAFSSISQCVISAHTEMTLYTSIRKRVSSGKVRFLQYNPARWKYKNQIDGPIPDPILFYFEDQQHLLRSTSINRSTSSPLDGKLFVITSDNKQNVDHAS